MSLYEEASTTTTTMSNTNNNSPSANYSNNPNATQHNDIPVITSPTDGSTIDVEKRKRGRPRKYPADVYSPLPPPGSTQHNDTPVIESPTDGSTIDVEKRKRGRPRKYPADVSVSLLPPPGSTRHNYTPVMTSPTDGSTIDVVKRKRGRPRKYDVSVSPSMLPPPPSSTAAAASEMETQRLTEYERRRLENIKRNNEMLGSFKIKSKLADLTAFIKPHRVETNMSRKMKPKTPTVTRRSLRSQGKVPDSRGLKDKFRYNLRESKDSKPSKRPKDSKPSKRAKTIKSLWQLHNAKFMVESRPLSMKDANTCSKSDQILISLLKIGDVHDRVKASIDLDSMKLAPKNVANVLPGMIRSIKFFPSTDMRMVVVGNQLGTIGFWNVDSEKEDDDGIYKYHTNPGLVSAILIQPFSMNKITTSCYGGQIRSLDIEKEIFALSYSTDNRITSMAQQPGDVNSLYFGEGKGVVRQWDQRSRKSILSWNIHKSIVNTIDFNPENTNIMATSSSDKTACIWDLRKLNMSKPEFVKSIVHKNVVYSAYFSPSGSCLATTSINDKIGVLSGTNYDEEFMINHNNQTGSFIPSFKARWGWDDSYFFVGNKKKGIDVISAYTKTLVTTLKSPHMSAIPCHFDSHPFIPGMLAGATGKGQVYIWTS